MSTEPLSLLGPGSVPRISYAPNHEDILLDRVFGDHVGTYMSVGSSGPIFDNLTYFFYRRGWRGVNLEPSPRLLAEFNSARPGDLNLPVLAWDANGEVPLEEVAPEGPHRASASWATTDHRYRSRDAAVDERAVSARTISSLVEELGIDPPDLLVIAARGTEHAAIRGVSLDAWRPRVIVVRSIPSASSSSPVWEPPLLGRGYLYATFNGVYRFYLRDDLGEARRRLAVPVNVLDRFRSAEVASLEARVSELEQQSRHWRVDLAHRDAERDDRLVQAERRRERWERECETLRQELIATQRTLRPYRLLDRLGVVSLGYRWIRRLKTGRSC